MGGVKIEAPNAPRGGVWGGVSPSPLVEGFGEGLCSLPRKMCIFLHRKFASLVCDAL